MVRDSIRPGPEQRGIPQRRQASQNPDPDVLHRVGRGLVIGKQGADVLPQPPVPTSDELIERRRLSQLATDDEQGLRGVELFLQD